MQTKHIGTNGRVRRTFENVSSIYQHGNAMVSVNRVEISVDNTTQDTTLTVPIKYQVKNWSYEYPIALISLAPGESVERVDEPVEPLRT